MGSRLGEISWDDMDNYVGNNESLKDVVALMFGCVYMQSLSLRQFQHLCGGVVHKMRTRLG